MTDENPALSPEIDHMTDAEVREQLRGVGESRRALDEAREREFADMKATLARVRALLFGPSDGVREWSNQGRSGTAPVIDVSRLRDALYRPVGGGDDA